MRASMPRARAAGAATPAPMPSAKCSARCSATSSAAVAAAADARRCFRGADLKYELEIDLGQAVFGHSVEIDVAKLMECDTCGGSGAAKGHKPVTCETCNGVGQVRISQGFFQLQQPCPKCRGSGTIIKNPCDTCLGQGRVRRSQAARGQDSRRRRYRRSHSPVGRRRGRAQRRTAGRSVRRSARARARDLRARRRAPVLRGAGQLREPPCWAAASKCPRSMDTCR